jgi:hypothetical protein
VRSLTVLVVVGVGSYLRKKSTGVTSVLLDIQRKRLMDDMMEVKCSHCRTPMEVNKEDIEYLEGACPDTANVQYLCEDCYLIYSMAQDMMDKMESTEIH